jgi:hypothetical protein
LPLVRTKWQETYTVARIADCPRYSTLKVSFDYLFQDRLDFFNYLYLNSYLQITSFLSNVQ